MATFVKLPRYILNLEQIRLIEFEPCPPTVIITWSSGYEATILRGIDALALIDAVEQSHQLIDISNILQPEELSV
jgi:hypothetical protein